MKGDLPLNLENQDQSTEYHDLLCEQSLSLFTTSAFIRLEIKTTIFNHNTASHVRNAFLYKHSFSGGSCEIVTYMMKVNTPTLQMSAGGPTTSPFNISGAEGEETKINRFKSPKKYNETHCFYCFYCFYS